MSQPNNLEHLRVAGIDGRVAFVTGASGGIGAEIVRTLAAQGGRVAGADLQRDPNSAADLEVQCDVTDEASVDRACTEVERALGPIEIVVSNAGLYRLAPVTEMSLESWREVIEVNLTGAFLVVRRTLPAMVAAGFGRVIMIGSSAGKSGGAKATGAYAAGKAGVMALTRSVARDYAACGITANALAPALIDTPMIAGVRDLVDHIPVGRLGLPADVAAVVAFLASEHASFITGEIVDVNGGFLID